MSLLWKQVYKHIVNGKKKLRLFAASFLIFSISGCYVTRLAFHHNNLFNSRRLISEVYSDKQTSEKIKKKIISLQKILSFAREEGLNVENAYRYYIEIDQDVVSYIVQAAHQDKLKNIYWWFPIVGSVPYLGFYDQTERDEKAAELRLKGYDVYEGDVGAFSSLGWFEDPIYSSMFRRSTASLANLVFHELVHRTYWVPGSTTFNENVATYLADALTVKFLQKNKWNKMLIFYNQKKNDKKLYKKWLSELKTTLEELYEKFPVGDKKLLIEEKNDIYRVFTQKKRPAFEVVDYIGDGPWNNATFLAASLYNPDLGSFKKAFLCSDARNAGEFLHLIQSKLEIFSDPFEALQDFCPGSDSATNE